MNINTKHIFTFLVLIQFLLLTGTASASIVIHQVLYDPIGTESGGEAVQLKNTGTTPISVSGWTLRTSTSAVDATIPEGVVLGPESTYLIADPGWSADRDDPSWPDADIEESITLRNTDSGVGLFNGTVKIDAVGWGTPDNMLLFEGTPAAPVAAGESLLRTQDTNDNSIDFTAQPASFLGAGTSDMSQSITLSVTVTSSLFAVEETILVDDDLTTTGIQLIPSPGSDRIIPITVLLNSSTDVTLQATFAGQDISFIETSPGTFSGSLLLSSTVFPGTYTIEFTATTALQQHKWTQDFEVMGIVAFSLSSSTIEFGNLSMSEESLQEIVITNLGNIALDLGVDGTDLVFGEHVLSLDHVTVHYDEVDEPGKIVSVTSLPQILNTDILPHQNASIGLGLTVPSSLASGRYTGALTLLGVGN